MIDRRTFLGGAAALLAWPAVRARAETPALPDELARALEDSPFVYVSPLRADGSESRCHGEVWYGWFDGSAVLITATGTWKARAVARGLDRARVWVGDFGRWKSPLWGTDESFRKGPSFDARAATVRDDRLLDRLLALYERKYPDEIGSWRDRMRQGYRDGSRVLIRYTPDRT